MNILALDTATRTGWARNRHISAKGKDTALLCGVEDFSLKTATKTREADHFGSRFDQFDHWLQDEIVTGDVGLVVYEKIVGGRKAGGNTTLIQKGLEALVWKNAAAHDIPVWNFAAGTIKKWATGNGTLGVTGKVEMVKAALAKGWELPEHRPTKSEPWTHDDNVADALWLHDLATAVFRHTYHPDKPYHAAYTGEQLTAIANKVTHDKWSRAKQR